MPPKAKFSREEIITAALKIARTQGIESVTARELGSSARPIFTVFQNMEEVLEEVLKGAREIYKKYVEQGLSETPAFCGVGMAYIRFAIEEEKLFHLLFMREQEPVDSIEQILMLIDESYDTILRSVEEPYHLSREDTKRLYQHLWIYSHGIAALCATGMYAFTTEEIGEQLAEIFIGLLQKVKADEGHKKELGIMKALGYSEFRIAFSFFIFAASVFIGTASGFGGAFLLMPIFYETQIGEGYFPAVEITFHPQLMITMVVLPTFFFGMLSVVYAYLKLKTPTVDLLKERLSSGKKPREKALIFFAVFGVFCFSAMVQMSSRMNEFSEGLMVVMIFIIGITLAGVTLLMALTIVVKRNTKNIVMMRVLGYSFSECRKAVLNKYRIFAYIGFLIGTLYQHLLLKIMINIVFRDVDNIPIYKFNVLNCVWVFISFVLLYEGILYGYGRRIRKISVKEVMLE